MTNENYRTVMSAKEKKELINKRLAEGDKRSYNEIAADLELELWNESHQGRDLNKQRLPLKP